MKKFVSKYGATTRRNIVLAILLLFALFVFLRVIYLQVFDSDFLIKQGDIRFIRVKKEPALRGTILDRNSIPLAVSTPVSSIWVNPKEILDEKKSNNSKLGVKKSIEILSIMTDYPLQDLKDKLKKKEKSSFMYVKRGLDPYIANKIIEKKIPGVYRLREYRRYYPSADVAAQIIGFTDINDKGQEGIELLYNNWLKGKTGSFKVIRDRSGRVVDILDEITPPIQGQDLMLTIDKRIQYLTYISLLEAVERYEAKSATAVILDAKTSEVLAMVSVPSGNPNDFKDKKASLIKNRAMTDAFEPGSVMKPFVVAEAMDLGLVNENTTIDTGAGIMKIGKNIIRDTHSYGRLDVSSVIKKSSNVGVCKIALKFPRDTLYDVYSSLGFGKRSIIGFPGEQKGVLNKMTKKGDFEYCTNAYGYGVSVTALQLAQAYIVFANDGVMTPASLIKKNKKLIGTRIISKETVDKIKVMLSEAVNEGGTGVKATEGSYIKGYTVGGKTGTAHKVINGKYSKENYFSVFAGIAPLSDPKVVMVVMVDDPKGEKYYGGLVAAPVFAKVVGKTLRILGVEPDEK